MIALPESKYLHIYDSNEQNIHFNNRSCNDYFKKLNQIFFQRAENTTTCKSFTLSTTLKTSDDNANA